jgi:hypothetical protein
MAAQSHSKLLLSNPSSSSSNANTISSPRRRRRPTCQHLSTTFVFLAILCSFLISTKQYQAAFDVPCTRESFDICLYNTSVKTQIEKLIGHKCLFDEECYGANTVCRDGRCTCPTNFEEFDLDEAKTICRLGWSQKYERSQTDSKMFSPQQNWRFLSTGL